MQMISTMIVLLSLLMAAIFTLVYWLNPAMRRRIEAPKYVFLQQLSKYDQSSQESKKQRSEAPRP